MAIETGKGKASVRLSVLNRHPTASWQGKIEFVGFGESGAPSTGSSADLATQRSHRPRFRNCTRMIWRRSTRLRSRRRSSRRRRSWMTRNGGASRTGRSGSIRGRSLCSRGARRDGLLAGWGICSQAPLLDCMHGQPRQSIRSGLRYRYPPFRSKNSISASSSDALGLLVSTCGDPDSERSANSGRAKGAQAENAALALDLPFEIFSVRGDTTRSAGIRRGGQPDRRQCKTFLPVPLGTAIDIDDKASRFVSIAFPFFGFQYR